MPTLLKTGLDTERIFPELCPRGPANCLQCKIEGKLQCQESPEGQRWLIEEKMPKPLRIGPHNGVLIICPVCQTKKYIYPAKFKRYQERGVLSTCSRHCNMILRNKNINAGIVPKPKRGSPWRVVL